MDNATKKQYYSKALAKMVTAYHMAVEQRHPYANSTIKLPSADGKEAVTVMSVEHSVEWIVKHLAPELLNSSWRLIRSGLKLVISSQVSRGNLTEAQSEKLVESMYEKCWKTKTEKRNLGEKMNSTSIRKKCISQAEYDKICEFINNPEKKEPLWGRPTLLWLTCSMLTGLRPNEWKGAELKDFDGKLMLVVKNFKFNEKRAPSEYRTLEIGHYSETEIDIIKQHLSVAKAIIKQDMWDKYYRGCSNLLNYINSQVFSLRKTSIGLYTGRHQFTANLKSSNMDAKTRSAILGHKSTDTQVAHYGKRRSSSHGNVPKNGDPSVIPNIRDNQKLQGNRSVLQQSETPKNN
jgi:polyhydroxyalkanoate synthesis regulator phasin